MNTLTLTTARYVGGGERLCAASAVYGLLDRFGHGHRHSLTMLRLGHVPPVSAKRHVPEGYCWPVRGSIR